ncbi:MAG: hypothetical protein M0Z99_16265, partial [Betaproteobacteria bacterium]|nr:hypothetical protein [Betaproteobacteria bacterium]
MDQARKTKLTDRPYLTPSKVTLPPQARNPHRRQINLNRLKPEAKRHPSLHPKRTTNRMPVRRIETAPPAFPEYMLLWGLVAAGIAAFIVHLCRKRHVNKHAASGSSVALKEKATSARQIRNRLSSLDKSSMNHLHFLQRVRRRRTPSVPALMLMLAFAAATPALAQEAALGTSVESLLDYAKARNPEYAAMRLEADAARERVYPAGALPDPMLRTELQNITNFGAESGTSFNLLPSRVGSTKYTLI